MGVKNRGEKNDESPGQGYGLSKSEGFEINAPAHSCCPSLSKKRYEHKRVFPHKYWTINFSH